MTGGGGGEAAEVYTNQLDNIPWCHFLNERVITIDNGQPWSDEFLTHSNVVTHEWKV